MEQKKIRIAIIGAGAIADVHIKAYLQYPDLCEVCAVCDLFPEKAEQLIQANGLTAAKAYKDCREAIASGGIDAVSICVENRSHAEICTAALYAGKHVLVEKPMAVTLAECESMVAAAERNGRHLMVGHNMRFDPVHRKAKELLDGKDCPVSELFSRCGFTSKSVFYVAFRKVVGMTPLQYISQSRSPFMIQRN